MTTNSRARARVLECESNIPRSSSCVVWAILGFAKLTESTEKCPNVIERKTNGIERDATWAEDGREFPVANKWQMDKRSKKSKTRPHTTTAMQLVSKSFDETNIYSLQMELLNTSSEWSTAAPDEVTHAQKPYMKCGIFISRSIDQNVYAKFEHEVRR